MDKTQRADIRQLYPHKGPQFWAAVDALDRLTHPGPVTAEDASDYELAFGAVAQYERLERLKHDHAITVGGSCCPCLLFRSNCPEELGDCPRYADTRVWDHVVTWYRGGELIAVVSQPYDRDAAAIGQLAAVREEDGLAATIRADVTTHFPGCTFAIVITRDGERL